MAACWLIMRWLRVFVIYGGGGLFARWF